MLPFLDHLNAARLLLFITYIAAAINGHSHTTLFFFLPVPRNQTVQIPWSLQNPPE